jgi:hypothetical protein
MTGSGGAVVRRASEARQWRRRRSSGARVPRAGGGSCGLGRARARGGALNRDGREPRRAGSRRRAGGAHRTAVGIVLESDPVEGKGTGPIGGTHPSEKRRERKRVAWRNWASQ